MHYTMKLNTFYLTLIYSGNIYFNAFFKCLNIILKLIFRLIY